MITLFYSKVLNQNHSKIFKVSEINISWSHQIKAWHMEMYDRQLAGTHALKKKMYQPSQVQTPIASSPFLPLSLLPSLSTPSYHHPSSFLLWSDGLNIFQVKFTYTILDYGFYKHISGPLFKCLIYKMETTLIIIPLSCLIPLWKN